MDAAAPWSSVRLPSVPLDRRTSPSAMEQHVRLACRVAHSIGNWSAAVLGNAERWRDECAHTPAADRGAMRADRIRNAMEQALELRRHLEAFVSGAAPPEGPACLARLLDAATVDQLCAALPRPLTRCRVRTPTHQAPSELDQSHLRICLVALLANAADALVDRSGDVRVGGGCAWLTTRDLQPMLHHPQATAGCWNYLAVEDDGEGVDEKQLPHLFAPAYSTRLRQDGFGLSDVFGVICRKARGAIGLWTRKDVGTRVTLFWPATGEPQPVDMPGDQHP